MKELENKKIEDQNEEEKYDDIYLNEEQRKLLMNTKFLIRGHSRWKLRWDLVVMTLAIFNCFSIPFEVSFEPQEMNTIVF